MGRPRVRIGHQHHDRGRPLLQRLDREHREQIAEQQAAGVAEEDRRGREVEAQESGEHAGERHGHHRRVGPVLRQRHEKQRHGGDQAGAGGQAVEAVDEVEGVGDDDDPGDGQQGAERTEPDDAAADRVGQRVEAVAAVDGDQRRERLPRELGRRADAAQIVEAAEQQDQHRAGAEPAETPAVRCEQIEHADAQRLRQQQRAGAGDEERHAAQARDASLVHAAAAAAINRAELQRRGAHRRRHDDRQAAGGDEQSKRTMRPRALVLRSPAYYV